MIFKSKNIVLRPWEDSDAESLYNYAKNPNIGPIAGWPPHISVEYSLDIIRTVFKKPETYAVIFKGEAIGCVGLLLYPDGNHYWGKGNCELGYWIAEEYWGNGFAGEASEILIKRAFDDFKLNIVFASYNVENDKSKRVLEKLGFGFYGEMENIDYRGKNFHEIVMYLKNESI